jgi:hypothetical protein
MNTIYSILQQNPLGLAILGLLAALILWRLIKLMVRVAAIVALVLAGYMAYRLLTGTPMLPAQGMANQHPTTASQANHLAGRSTGRPLSRLPARADFGL